MRWDAASFPELENPNRTAVYRGAYAYALLIRAHLSSLQVSMEQFMHNALHSGFLRLSWIIGDATKGILPLIPVSRATWYAGIKSGKYPKPIRLSEGVSVWRTSDIDSLCQQIEQKASESGK